MGLVTGTLEQIVTVGAALWSQLVSVILWLGDSLIVPSSQETAVKPLTEGFSASASPIANRRRLSNAGGDNTSSVSRDARVRNTKSMMVQSNVTSVLDEHLRTLIKERYASGTNINKKGLSCSTSRSSNDLTTPLPLKAGFSPLQDDVMKVIQEAKYSRALGDKNKQPFRRASVSSVLSVDSIVSASSLDPSSFYGSSRGTSRGSQSPSPSDVTRGTILKRLVGAPPPRGLQKIPLKEQDKFLVNLVSDTDEEVEQLPLDLKDANSEGDQESEKRVKWTPRMPAALSPVPEMSNSRKKPARCGAVGDDSLEPKSGGFSHVTPYPVLSVARENSSSVSSYNSSSFPKSSHHSSEGNVTSSESLPKSSAKAVPRFDITGLKDEILALREEISARKGKLASCSVPHITALEDRCFVTSVEDITSLRKEISALKKDFFSLLKDNTKQKVGKLHNLKKISGAISKKDQASLTVKSGSIDSIDEYGKTKGPAASVIRRLNSFNGIPLKGTTVLSNLKKKCEKPWQKDHARLSLSQLPPTTTAILETVKKSESFKALRKYKSNKSLQDNSKTNENVYSSESIRAFKPRAATMQPVKGVYFSFSCTTLQKAVQVRLAGGSQSESRNGVIFDDGYATDDDEEEEGEEEEGEPWLPSATERACLTQEELVLYGLRPPPSNIRKLR